MGFIYGMKSKFPRKSAENLFPNILAWAELWLVKQIVYTVWVKIQLLERMLTLLDFGKFTEL